MNILGNVVNSGRIFADPPNFADFIDSANSIVTSNFLIVLAVISSYKQFGGHPIECLIPDNLPFIGVDKYAENFCWAQDTYSVLMHEIVDGMPKNERQQRKISYYQWVPFFLLIEAACFRLPSLLWKYMSGQSGIKIQEICKLSGDPNNIKPDIKRANIRSLAVHLEGALRFHRRLHKKQLRPHQLLRMFNLPYSACYVTITYLITKFCYLFNVVVQLFLMNKFLETDKYQFYGFGAILDLLRGKTWETSGVFPRISLCDFQVRVMGNIQEHTIQCVLVINIFNEKIFIFLWFWYVFLLVFTAGSFLYWLLVAFFPWPNIRFIKRHLEMSELDIDPDEKDKEVRRFVKKFLRIDGLFVLRMLTLHSGVIFGTEVIQELWTRHFRVELKRANSETRIAVHLEGALRFHRRLHKKQLRPHQLLRMFNLPYSACYVTITYLITKFCYLFNVVVQLFLMNKFLETDKYQFYGFGAILDLLRGKTWETSGVFPRISLCDFQVRVMGNIQEHTIQCVLVINIFNEKIFIFLWFWYVFLLVFTAGSFLYWLLVAFFPWPNIRFIKRHLEMSELDIDPDEKDKEVRRFVKKFLRIDGLFVLRMLTLHSGVIFGTEVIQELWTRHFRVELKRANSETRIVSPSKSGSVINSPTNQLRNRKFNDSKYPEYGSLRRNSSVTEQLIAPPPPPDYVLKELLRRNSVEQGPISSPSTQSTSPTIHAASPQPPEKNNNHDHGRLSPPKPHHHFPELPTSNSPIMEPIREVPEPKQVSLTVNPTGPATAAILRPYRRDDSPGQHLTRKSLEARPADPPRHPPTQFR
uniref:Innexin n=1 Tax=Bursaphelenchus xylophilus TaxID=6326 RepID=A0A1I7SDL3_BURXY